jgi:hypothetical protein
MHRLTEAKQSWLEASAIFEELHEDALAAETRDELSTLSGDIKVLP